MGLARLTKIFLLALIPASLLLFLSKQLLTGSAEFQGRPTVAAPVYRPSWTEPLLVAPEVKVLMFSAIHRHSGEAIGRAVKRFQGDARFEWMLVHFDCEFEDQETAQSAYACLEPFMRAPWYKHVKYKRVQAGFKPQLRKMFLQPELIRHYDYVWLFDCDMEIALVDHDLLFSVIQQQKSLLAMPAYISATQLFYRVVIAQSGLSLARITDFVEVGCAVVRTDYLDMVLDYIPTDVVGDWGIALWWCALPLWRMPSNNSMTLHPFHRACMVVDAAPVVHRHEGTMPKDSAGRLVSSWPRKPSSRVTSLDGPILQNNRDMHVFDTVLLPTNLQRRKESNIWDAVQFACRLRRRQSLQHPAAEPEVVVLPGGFICPK